MKKAPQKTVKVGYKTITITGLDDIEAADSGLLGRYSFRQDDILLKRDMTPAKQASVLLHELLHACFDVYGLDTEKLTEEQVCEALDGPLTALFTDNPLLAGWLHQAVSQGRKIIEE